MNLDEELESIEASGETEAEWIDQESELEDYESQEDEILGEDASESDLEHDYASFMTKNEEDFNGVDGWDNAGYDEDTASLGKDEFKEQAQEFEDAGYEVIDRDDLEAEVIEMEIEDGDIYAFIVDENDEEIGFILLDEDGNEVEYYYVEEEYVSEDDELKEVQGEVVDQEGDRGVRVIRASDEEEFDLGITKEQMDETAQGAKEILKEGIEVAREFKEAFDDITEGLDFLKKKPRSR